MKRKCVIKKLLLSILFALCFCLGFIASKIHIEPDRIPEQLMGKQYVDIGEVETHNKALRDFYLKYQRGIGFAAIRETSVGGFDGPMIVYLITDDGKFTALFEEEGLFCNSYKEIKPKSLKIGYEDSEGNFVKIDPENYNTIDLTIVVDN